MSAHRIVVLLLVGMSILAFTDGRRTELTAHVKVEAEVQPKYMQIAKSVDLCALRGKIFQCLDDDETLVSIEAVDDHDVVVKLADRDDFETLLGQSAKTRCEDMEAVISQPDIAGDFMTVSVQSDDLQGLHVRLNDLQGSTDSICRAYEP
eukprot:gnl/TRDRNA2_/TRDRNA2_193272_c0_seq1.p1 gnl/TRDRNA2_/TRDRNA2_193272_c0~~gnl/TRDRNA2_/TRDRNA2_193272_c0_seq1.p1  ORF type:complete len:150 (-),score=29.20 gnl/TRDRNA2_/TRDRNA2_193272_c0_seq1:92-541(-)